MTTTTPYVLMVIKLKKVYKKGKSHLLPLSVCDHLIRGFQIITKYKTVDKEVYKSRGYMSMVISLLFIISIDRIISQ